MEFNYERLEVVQISKKLIPNIYKITEKLPKSEMYGLISQIRRAVVSVLLNIAEGSSRQSKKEFKQFVRLSIGSLIEVDCGLKIAVDLDYLGNDDCAEAQQTIRELYFKLIGLVKYLSQS